MRVLVCGGRDHPDPIGVRLHLDSMHAASPIACVITGDARGVDRTAMMWANENGVPTEPYPADWEKHGRAAGPIRNRQMLDEGKPDLVVAFPGGRGTADLVRRAKAAGIPVREVEA